jgi:hypothetical protein
LRWLSLATVKHKQTKRKQNDKLLTALCQGFVTKSENLTTFNILSLPCINALCLKAILSKLLNEKFKKTPTAECSNKRTQMIAAY